jgi:hypothetical protein
MTPNRVSGSMRHRASLELRARHNRQAVCLCAERGCSIVDLHQENRLASSPSRAGLWSFQSRAVVLPEQGCGEVDRVEGAKLGWHRLRRPIQNDCIGVHNFKGGDECQDRCAPPGHFSVCEVRAQPEPIQRAQTLVWKYDRSSSATSARWASSPPGVRVSVRLALTDPRVALEEATSGRRSYFREGSA